MSDFDKEAERERLREQYEREQQKREATERMSELLLKGATMTNAHCETCGDPIFRYDGQEFCPTCQQPVGDGQEGAGESGETADAGGAAAESPDDARSGTPESAADQSAAAAADADAAANGAPERDADSPDHIEIKQPTGPQAQSGGTGADAPAEAEPADTPPTAETAPGDAPDSPADRSAASPSDARGTDPSPDGPEPADRRTQADRTDANAASGGLSTARASLVRALETSARRAEECEDPRRAREYLAAAREAAEALSALPY